MIDYNDYVGIPWVCGQATLEGADCWGIVTMVLYEALGIRIGHYSLDNIDSPEKVIETIEREIPLEISSGNWEKVAVPMEFDVVMMLNRSTCKPEHVGIYIGTGQVLHSRTRETGISEVHKIKSLKRYFKRLEYYRYVR